MKMSWFKISLSLIAFVGLVTACSDDTYKEGETQSLGGKYSFEVGIESGSRVTYNGYSSSFSVGDQLGVYIKTSDVYYQNELFEVNSGGAYAESQNILEGIEYKDSVYGYYPYVADADINALNVKMSMEQVQKDADFSHISEYDFLVATPSAVGRYTTSLMCTHIASWIDIVVYNNESSTLTVSSATISASSGQFVSAGTVNGRAAKTASDYLAVKPSSYSSTLKITADGDWAKADFNEAVTLRVALLPVDFSSASLTFTIETNQGTITETYTGQNFESGHCYEILFNDKEVYLPTSQISDYNTSFRFNTADLTNENTYFCWKRSMQSRDFVVFWESGFGDDPSTCTDVVDGVSMTVDVGDMLDKMEAFYSLYVNELGFLDPGNSLTDQYKMMIFLFHTSDWVASGSGVDDKIGTFWIAPSACHPIGQTVAHELGHALQYQTYCDNPSSGCGYRNNIGNGNVYWEMCSEYMAWQNLSYFSTWGCEIDVQTSTCHRGFTHEWLRYQDFYVINYWEGLYGRNFLGNQWRNAKNTEDAIQTIKRLYLNDSQTQFNDDIYQGAVRLPGVDYNNTEVCELTRKMLDRLSSSDRKNYYTHLTKLIRNTADNFYRPYVDLLTSDGGSTGDNAYALVPQQYGYNCIYLSVPDGGTEVTVTFQGLKEYPTGGYVDYSSTKSYNFENTSGSRLGWRWGFVALTGSDGWTPVYSEMQSANSGTLTFTVPENTKELYFVVTGAPTSHTQHSWDENVSNDYHFPYRFKLDGTDVASSYNRIYTEEVNFTYTSF